MLVEHLLGSIGEVLNGSIPGRLLASDITVFKSVGLIAEDLSAATHLFAKGAQSAQDGTVTWVDF